MPNMGYARFRNTLADLRDCYNGIEDAIDGEELSHDELRAAVDLVMLCGEIIRAVHCESSSDGLAQEIVDGDESARKDIEQTLDANSEDD